MAAHETKVYTIWCVLEDELSLFRIDVPSYELVIALKEVIQKAKKNALAKVDPDNLKLYDVEIKDFEDMPTDAKARAIKKKLAEHPGELKARRELSSVFKDGVKKATLVVVQRPETATTPPKRHIGLPLLHTPSKSKEELYKTIVEFTERYRSPMEKFLKLATNANSALPTWIPQFFADTELSQQISALQIPAILGGRPSLLLHELGEEKDDLDIARAARIPGILSFTHHTVLVNTSGSGKTRLLLEGLCRRWGFYFVAKPDMTGIGSSDLWDVIKGLTNANDYPMAQHLKGSSEEGEAKAGFDHIQEVAERRICQLVLARFLLLKLFTEEVKKLPGGLKQAEHRRLWVLLQVQPKILGDGIDDIFGIITGLLRGGNAETLRILISEHFTELSFLREPVPNPAMGKDQIPPFFCVLDEAQITTTEGLGDFISADNLTHHPILRQIWLTCTTLLRPESLRLVLSGTGIDLQALEDTLSSAAGKDLSYCIKSDIGAFDNPDAQAMYIKRYLPAPWSEPRWVEFLTRAWTWLRGRYRYTATLIGLLLAAGYQSPHTILDTYVERYTKFTPTDRRFPEPNLPDGFIHENMNVVRTLNFKKMNKMQVSTLSDVVYQQIVYGRFDLGAFSSTQRAAFVEYGFARHKQGKGTVLDEPLALLAALQWIDQDPTFSIYGCLRRDLNKHSPGQNGFEAYLAFHLRKVFEKSPKLDDGFSFRADFVKKGAKHLAWQHEEFELVVVAHTGEEKSPLVSVVTPSSGPSSSIGFSTDVGNEVLEWISVNEDRSTFCFPPDNLGPDLMFFIRSKRSRKLLLVLIQAKHYPAVDRPTLIKGVRTVTPSWLWKSKDTKHSTAAEAPFITAECKRLAPLTLKALASIPFGLTVGNGAYPVLRVFASWPAEAMLGRTSVKSGTKREDTDQHPLATLNLVNFNGISKEVAQEWFVQDVEQRIVIPSKRPNEGSEPGPLSKRPHRQA